MILVTVSSRLQRIFFKFFFLFKVEGIHLFLELFLTTISWKEKTLKKYRANGNYTMTKIIATHIRNINETFIAIFMGLPLAYNACYHNVHD